MTEYTSAWLTAAPFSAAFYGIAPFSLPPYPFLPVVMLLVCAYDFRPFTALHLYPCSTISFCASSFPVVPILSCHPIFPFPIARICCACVSSLPVHHKGSSLFLLESENQSQQLSCPLVGINIAGINIGAQRGVQTHDPEIKSLMLYRLSN